MQTGKNPFNFAVAEEVITYPFEQKPITDFQEFQPDLSKRGKICPPLLKRRGSQPTPRQVQHRPMFVHLQWLALNKLTNNLICPNKKR